MHFFFKKLIANIIIFKIKLLIAIIYAKLNNKIFFPYKIIKILVLFGNFIFTLLFNFDILNKIILSGKFSLKIIAKK